MSTSIGKRLHHLIVTDRYYRCFHSNIRVYSESRKQKQNTKASSENITRDWIGPADPVSNLIRYKFYVPNNESDIEKTFRNKRIEVNKWNQEFWENHNLKFYRMRDEYVEKMLKLKYPNDSKKKSLSPEEMSVFYKKFLDDHHQLHMWYNKEWYKKNISLLWPAVQVAIYRLKKKFQS